MVVSLNRKDDNFCCPAAKVKTVSLLTTQVEWKPTTLPAALAPLPPDFLSGWRQKVNDALGGFYHTSTVISGLPQNSFWTRPWKVKTVIQQDEDVLKIWWSWFSSWWNLLDQIIHGRFADMWFPWILKIVARSTAILLMWKPFSSSTKLLALSCVSSAVRASRT